MKKIIVPIILLFTFVFFASSFTSEKMILLQEEKNKKQPDTAKVDSVQIFLKFRPFKNGVHASYYHDKFNGRKTASGKRFDNSKLTAAHKKLPFGTKLKVINPVNGKSVEVTVTDRGPFTRGREIDLTKRAFMEITHAKGRGFLNVNIEIVKQK